MKNIELNKKLGGKPEGSVIQVSDGQAEHLVNRELAKVTTKKPAPKKGAGKGGGDSQAEDRHTAG